MAAKSGGKGPNSPLPLVITIYQNGEQVSGLLQQIHRQPLVTDSTFQHDDQQTSTSSKKRSGRVEGKAAAKVTLPVTPSAELGGGFDRGSSEDAQQAVSNRSTQNFVYSQAYYLALVRDALVGHNLIRTVNSTTDAASVSVGDFVQYTADFRANELGALLDTLTPAVIGRIVHNRKLHAEIAKIADWTNLDTVRANMERINAEADDLAALATTVTTAVQADFRTDATREFYGTVGDAPSPITMVTVCDNAHFVVADPDRILDGRFTVLGKAVSAVKDDVPVLERNKVLNRLRPDAVDRIFAELANAVDSTVTNPQGAQLLGGLKGSEVLDVQFASRIAGPSMRVVPLAIYA